MTRLAHFRTGLLAIAMLMAATVLMAGPAAAGKMPAEVAVSPTPPGDFRGVAQAADQGLRVDRSTRVLEATAYQTLTVAGVAGGAVLIGALAAGTTGAMTGAGAVIIVYLLMR